MTRTCALLVACAAAAAGCGGTAALTQQVEARRLVSELQVAFTKASDAANRAVMADTDESSVTYAKESQLAAQAADGLVRQLQPVLTSLGYSSERQALDTFGMCFADYRTLDDEILALAVENTNLKAQRLSFGTSAEAAEAFRAALDAAVKSAPAANASQARQHADRALIALLEIQVIQAPHIAESQDEAMTRMEQRMTGWEATVRMELRLLGALTAASQSAAATAAFDRFAEVNKDVVSLSRRNSNVRSLALSLGRKRMLVARCDDDLQALQEALSKRGLTATR